MTAPQIAYAYLRTSSATNVGGDSGERQRQAIQREAKAKGIKIVGEFYDEAVSGADHIEARRGFAEMLAKIEADGDDAVRLVMVEDASRLARSVLVAELAILVMAGRGVKIVTASGEDLTETDDPAKVMMRQVAASFAQYEKARMVAKLKGARDRAAAAVGKRLEGRKGYDDTNPALVREAKRLARKSPRTGKARSLRQIASELVALGFTTGTGKAFSASQVQRLVNYRTAEAR
jgi:DNA invertase Pin-like site-specific DNA recombinase